MGFLPTLPPTPINPASLAVYRLAETAPTQGGQCRWSVITSTIVTSPCMCHGCPTAKGGWASDGGRQRPELRGWIGAPSSEDFASRLCSSQKNWGLGPSQDIRPTAKMAWMAWLTLPVKGGSRETAPLTLRETTKRHTGP